MNTGHHHSQSRAIPTRTIPISDTTQLPHDYCTTPGGTLFSTTPGGTRIIYDRKFLLDRRNSPLAQTPPRRLPDIPGVTSPTTIAEEPKVETNNLNNHVGKPAIGDDSQFEMDIWFPLVMARHRRRSHKQLVPDLKWKIILRTRGWHTVMSILPSGAIHQ